MFIRSVTKPLRQVFLPVLVTLYSFVGAVRGQQPIDHLNIIVILADDLGYGDVGFNGLQVYVTPNTMALPINAVWFSSVYVTHPFGSPSRAALLTERYNH